MFEYTIYLFKNAPGIAALLSIASIVLFALGSLLFAMTNVKRPNTIAAILIVLFAFFFVGTTTIFGKLESVKNGLYEKICTEVYSSARYDVPSKTCYLTIIAKNSKLIEIPIKEITFNMIGKE